ncbi:hypothetical protein IGI04_035578 [Brassica rapa subsp. trilocularis]|uniref:ABC transmembrane type-1 domain-containing protein n=1 Tax=Brassica rapa subsp. trilocularis TaxID=1813537 RepID=A0ABQ7LC02_BRACM|nr:hypothetical protein IGI04_035578 [Brassica rapa subsp. trilocularis]
MNTVKMKGYNQTSKGFIKFSKEIGESEELNFIKTNMFSTCYRLKVLSLLSAQAIGFVFTLSYWIFFTLILVLRYISEEDLQK